MKDVPTQRAPGLMLAGTGEREDVRDALVSPRVKSIDKLPKGARVGTSSLRRQAQLLSLRPDLQIVSIRGNVQTRMNKIKELNLEGVILAAAGLRRLGFADRITAVHPAERQPAGDRAGRAGPRGPRRRRADARAHRHLPPRADRDRDRGRAGLPRASRGRLPGADRRPGAGRGRRSRWRASSAASTGRSCRDRGEGRRRAARVGRELAEKILDRGGRAILAEVYKNAGPS